MAIKVHGYAMSTCTARVLLCLSEKGLEYEVVPVDVANGAHKQQPYLSLNPESRAISKYLARKYKDTGIDLLGSSSLTVSTIVDTWMEVESHQFNSPMQAIIRQMIVNPIFGIATDEKIIETELEKLGKVLDVYEERLSKCKYLGGDFYSLADLHHIPYLVYFMRTPKSSVITSRPHVSAWWNDISSRPATVKVAETMKV
ncbi:Glutathione S-transferase [Theobroma cacao]|nr:Glutathione S-transferase [Theobroma cacao]